MRAAEKCKATIRWSHDVLFYIYHLDESFLWADIIIPILQMVELRLREARELA